MHELLSKTNAFTMKRRRREEKEMMGVVVYGECSKTRICKSLYEVKACERECVFPVVGSSSSGGSSSSSVKEMKKLDKLDVCR